MCNYGTDEEPMFLKPAQCDCKQVEVKDPSHSGGGYYETECETCKNCKCPPVDYLFYNTDYVMVFSANSLSGPARSVIGRYVVTDFADRAANPQGNGVMEFEAFNSKNYPNSCIFQILPLNSAQKGKVVTEKYFNLSVNGKTLRQSQSTTASCIYVTTQTGDVAQFSFHGGTGIRSMGAEWPLELTNLAGADLSYMTINSMTGGKIGSKGTIMYKMDTNCSPYGAFWYMWDVAFYAATPGTPPPSVEPIYNRGCMTKGFDSPSQALFKTQECNTDQCIPEKVGTEIFLGLCPYHGVPTPSTPSDDNGTNSGSKTFQTTIKNVMYGVLIVFGLMILAVIIRAMYGKPKLTAVQEALELQKMSPTK
jgi:hypothetical protein